MQILTDKRKTERGQPLSAPIGIVPAGESASPSGFVLSPLGTAVVGADWTIF